VRWAKGGKNDVGWAKGGKIVWDGLMTGNSEGWAKGGKKKKSYNCLIIVL